MLNLLNRYLELSKREKFLILVTVGVLIPLLVYRVLVGSIQGYQTRLERQNATLENSIQQITQLGQELRFLDRLSKKQKQALSKRIDFILNQTNLKTRSKISIGDRARNGQRLVLNLTEINLSELVNLIYKIENSTPVILIDSFDLSPSYQSEKLFRISLAISSE